MRNSNLFITKRVWSFVFVSLNFLSAMAIASAENSAVLTPLTVQVELQNYQDRFAQTLQDECPGQLCSAVGCELISFITLDEQQDSSLPGLESAQELTKNPQYKLSSLRCEFTYEASISSSELSTLRQRILAKTKLAGTSLNLMARKLSPRPAALTLKPIVDDVPSEDAVNGQTVIAENPWSKLSPWMFFSALLAVLSLLLIWGYRRIGKPKPINVMSTSTEAKPLVPEASAQMIISRIQQLKDKLATAGSLTLALKPLVQKAELKILCQVLRHFGPEAMAGFNDKIEYRDTLIKLREAYQNFTDVESNTDIWQFLDKVERYLVASDVGVEENPLAEEFLFIQTLDASEFFHLLKNMSEEDVALMLSFAPHHLQTTFFKQLAPQQLVNLIDQITKTKDISDKLVREKAKLIREIYQNRRAELKTISLDRLPMLEELLNSMEITKRNQLLQEMKFQNSDLFQALLGQMFMDKSLTLMSKETLNEIFVSVSAEKAAAYLDLLPFREEIFSRLNPVLVNSIQRFSRPSSSVSLGLNFLGADAFVESSMDSVSSNGLIESGRIEVAQIVREQVQKGIINLRSINESLLEIM